YTISLDGGSPELLVAESHAQTGANWSPDGNLIFYSRDPNGENQDIALYRVDLRTRRVERILGTEGLYGARWSPYGRQLAAQSTSADHYLVLFDVASQRKTVLSKRKADYPVWSADSRYIFFNSLMTREPAIFRVRVTDGREEKVADVSFSATGTYGSW